MLSFFRRIINSKVGVVLTFVFLALIALAFAASDVTGLGHSVGGMTAKTVARVGKADIPEAELVERTKNALQNYQQQQPGLDMAGFLAGGGMDGTLEQLLNAVALEQFAVGQGMVVSKRALDGQIAGIPALRGLDGKFSQVAYERLLAERKITDAQVRGDLTRETFAQQLTAPTIGATQVPVELALPYASLLLERRKGSIGFIPAKAISGFAAPTDAEVADWYKRNVARYTVPERRVIRYAMVTPDTVKAKTVPSDADIAAAYKDAAARFAPTEKRSVEIATALDQATATKLAAGAKGATVEASAKAAGLEARKLEAVDKATLSKQVSPGLADAVFGAAPNTVVGPQRITGVWVVFRVSKVEQVAGKTLAQARAELLPEVIKTKTAEALGAMNDTLDNAAAEGSSFNELVADQKLTAEATPPLLVNGQNPLDPAFKPAPTLAPILQAGFAAEQGDAPQIVPAGPDGSFALVTLDRVVPAAPRPLAEIRAAVANDFAADRAQKAARKVAGEVLARVDGGMPVAQALAATKLALPAVRAVDIPRAQIAANPGGAEPALALMFSMVEKKAKLLEAPGKAGWLIVHLDSIQRANARGNPQVVAQLRADLSRVVGREYVTQFGRAVRNDVGVKQNPSGIARAKAQLSGQTPDAGN